MEVVGRLAWAGKGKPSIAAENKSHAGKGEKPDVEWIPGPDGPAQRFTSADRWDYTVAKFRQIPADHDLPATSRTTHDELVALITAAGIDLPAKPLERMPPFRRRRGPLANP